MTAVSARLGWRPEEGVDSYQLMVFDRTDAQTILDLEVAVPEHLATIPAECANHDLVMRVRARRGERWENWTEFEPLPLEVILGERRAPQAELLPTDDPGLFLLFTIDTECSVLRQPNPDPNRVVDELIFGDFGNGGRPAGIGLHMDLLEHFGFRGCFFVDVLLEFEHGQEALERIIDAIAARGHEVELHVHPEHIQWSRDPQVASLAKELAGGSALHDPGAFRRLMECSVDLFERRVGRPPVAYRAGGYRIADFHFPVLEEFGIRIDSSVQPWFKSRVSDWMRARSQPFRVDGTLEAPPTYLILDEKPGAWETRGFTPNSYLGDPILSLRSAPGAPPSVLTFLSHSFELLRRRESDDPEVVDAFGASLRASISADLAARYLSGVPRAVRSFGPDIDDRHVAAVTGLLRRVADRPDARCVTYAELASVADRFWPAEAHPPTDLVPTIDRNLGKTGVTGTRVYGPGLLAHLAERGPANPGPEEAESTGKEEAIRRPGDRRVRFRPLGVAPLALRGALPPLTEILFPVAAIEELAGQLGTRPWKGLPWDGATFKAWLRERGFEVVAERAIPRSAQELAALTPFAEKLAWLDRAELETEVLELELRPTAEEPRPAEGADRLDPTTLPAAATDLYDSLHPGEKTRLRIPELSSPATRTTRLLALMRTGLEIVARDGDEYTLIRPLDLADIRRFAGL
jgi:hypothetical protein